MNNYRILVVDDEEDLVRDFEVQPRKRRLRSGYGKLCRRSPTNGHQSLQLTLVGCNDG